MHPIQEAIDLLLELRDDLIGSPQDADIERIDAVVKVLRLELSVLDAKGPSELSKIAAVGIGAAALAASVALAI